MRPRELTSSSHGVRGCIRHTCSSHGVRGLIRLTSSSHTSCSPSPQGRLSSSLPIGIPTPRDKMVQEVMRNLLEEIYEPIFTDNSHGFRTGRSCHTALKQTSIWNGYEWCIEGDIKGFFDNVNHHKLEGLLKKQIEDQQFIDLY